MPCPRCIERGKDWEGDDPKCAFELGVFSTNNWNCATMNDLRDLVNTDCFGTEVDTHSWGYRDDMWSASFGVLRIPEAAHNLLGNEDENFQGYLVMTWYKNRGRTGQAWIVNDDEPPKPLTLLEAEAVLVAINRRLDSE
jgi:hypothetical protein